MWLSRGVDLLAIVQLVRSSSFTHVEEHRQGHYSNNGDAAHHTADDGTDGGLVTVASFASFASVRIPWRLSQGRVHMDGDVGKTTGYLGNCAVATTVRTHLRASIENNPPTAGLNRAR